MLFWQLIDHQLNEILYHPYAQSIGIQLKLVVANYSLLLTAEKR